MAETRLLTVRIPTDLVERLDALVAPVADELRSGVLLEKVGRSHVIRLALVEGLEVLEAKHGTSSRTKASGPAPKKTTRPRGRPRPTRPGKGPPSPPMTDDEVVQKLVGRAQESSAAAKVATVDQLRQALELERAGRNRASYVPRLEGVLRRKEREAQGLVLDEDHPGMRLRRWREAQGLHQGEAGKRLGAVQQTIGYIEQGKRRPGPDLAARIEAEAGIPADAWAEVAL